MKSVIVFYIPLIMGETDAVKAERTKIKNHLYNLDLIKNDFHIIIVEDP